MSDKHISRPDEEDLTGKTGTDCDPQSDSNTESRRHAIKIGLITPIILSLKSQTALAGGTCFTPSRSVSKNTSLTQKKFIGTCNGVSPGNYKTQWSGPACHWPISTCTLFHQYFAKGLYGTFMTSNKTATGCSKIFSCNSLHPRSMTMLEILNLNGNQDPYKVAFHVIGAYLNILNGYISNKALTVNALQTIWHDYATNGYYEPTAGVKWYGGDIVTYLQNNYIAP